MSENQKKVWVTGASSGIGKAVAEKFAKENWKVAISARREELLNEIAKIKYFFLPFGCYRLKKNTRHFQKNIR